MKKLLWTICFISIGLNTYLIKFEQKETQEIQPIEQQVNTLYSSLEKEVPLKKAKENDCVVSNKVVPTVQKKQTLEEKIEKEMAETFDYDTFKKESSQKIDRFALEELNLGLEASAQIVKIFEDGQKKFDKYLEDKQKSANPDGEPEGYFFDAYDYITMGRNRLETRRKLKTFLGDDSFKQLEQFFKTQRTKGSLAYEIL